MYVRRLLLISGLALFVAAVPLYAVGVFPPKVQKFVDTRCDKKNLSIEHASMCFLLEKVSAIESELHSIEDHHGLIAVKEIRGPHFITNSLVPVPVGNALEINCPTECTLSVDYFVNTRNSGVAVDPRGFFNLFSLYIDGVNQAITNQASFPVPNVAVPFALNGAIPVSAGLHTVELYGWVNGGEMENHESGLRVMAFER